MYAAGGDFVVGWQSLDDFVGDDMTIVFEPETSDSPTPGPIEITVQDGGVALMSVTEDFDGDETYDIYWYVNGNGNGSCDDSDVDPKGHTSADLGVSGRGISYRTRLSTDGVCSHF